MEYAERFTDRGGDDYCRQVRQDSARRAALRATESRTIPIRDPEVPRTPEKPSASVSALRRAILSRTPARKNSAAYREACAMLREAISREIDLRE